MGSYKGHWRFSTRKKFALKYGMLHIEFRMDSVWCRETVKVVMTSMASLSGSRIFSVIVYLVFKSYERRVVL